MSSATRPRLNRGRFWLSWFVTLLPFLILAAWWLVRAVEEVRSAARHTADT